MTPAPVARGSRRRRPRVLLAPSWAIVLLICCYIGAFKGNELLTGVPVDLTAASAVLVLIGIITYLVRGGRLTRTTLVPFAVWATFVPGALISWQAGYGIRKTELLFGLTLLISVAVGVMLESRASRRVWIHGHLIVAIIMLLLVAFLPDPTAEGFGRLAVEGGTTIVSGQVLGAGSVVALIMAFTPGQAHRLILLGLAGVLAVGVVLAGSRGPFSALLAALTVTMLIGRVYRRARPIVVGCWALLLVLTLWLVVNSDSRAAQRLTTFLGGERDPIRGALYHAAWNSIVVRPQGVGWSGFAYLIGRGGDQAAGTPVYPHNIVLETAVEGGWIAGLALVVLLVSAFILLWRRSTDRDGIVLFGLAVYWIVAAQASSDINGNRMLWAAIMVAFVRTAPELLPAKTPARIRGAVPRRTTFPATERSHPHDERMPT